VQVGIARFERLGSTGTDDMQQSEGGAGGVLLFEGIAGRVVAGDGNALTRGVILARFHDGDAIVANAPVTKTGAFAFPRLQPGRYLLTYKNAIHGSEYEMTDGGIELEEWRTGVELRLAAGATVEGLVFDPAGAVKPGVWIRATHGTMLTGATTDKEGRFRIKGLVPGGTYKLTCWLNGYLPEQREARAGERDVRFELDAGLSTNAVLRWSDGKAVAGQKVLLRSASGLYLPAGLTTDENGAFDAAGLPDDVIHVAIRKGKRLSCGSFRAGDRDVVLTVETN